MRLLYIPYWMVFVVEATEPQVDEPSYFLMLITEASFVYSTAIFPEVNAATVTYHVLEVVVESW
jgi:hypothetical protein